MPVRIATIEGANPEPANTKEKSFGAKTKGNERRKTSVVLWTVQALLAALFLFAGGMKLWMPLAELTGQTQLPGLFIRFIGVAEVLGALGLILPGLLRIRPLLTPLAAVGLMIIMSGATGLTVAGSDTRMALIPLLTGLSSALIAYGRWRMLPHRASSLPASIPTQR